MCNPCLCRRRGLQSRSYHPLPTGIRRRYDPWHLPAKPASRWIYCRPRLVVGVVNSSLSSVPFIASRGWRPSSRHRNLQHRCPKCQMFRSTRYTPYGDWLWQCSGHCSGKRRKADLRTKEQLWSGSRPSTSIPRAQIPRSRLRYRC